MTQEHVQPAPLLLYGYRQQRNRFLQRHPLLTPLLLLSGSVLLWIASSIPDSPFPLLAVFGIPSLPFCLSLALVLGTSGSIISIINTIEYFNRYNFKIAMFPKSKEHSYASN